MTNKLNQSSLLLAGVRKCGTTTLFDMLAQHSNISPASAKESQFFACDKETVSDNLDWYKKLFDQDEDKTLLDGSTWYFGSPDSAELINKYLPNSRIVLCLRDPASRVFSGYLHMKKQTPSQEKRSFIDIIESIEKKVHSGHSLYTAEDSTLEDAVNLNQSDADGIQENFHKNRFNAPFKTKLSDKRFSFRYFTESSYSQWLTSWEQTFGERLLIVYFEDLMKQPEKVISEILNFAQLDFEDKSAKLLSSNETRLPKGKLSNILMSYRKNSKLGNLIATSLKAIGLKKAGAWLREKYLYKGKEKPSSDEILRVRELLNDEYIYWNKRDPRTADIWSKPKQQTQTL